MRLSVLLTAGSCSILLVACSRKPKTPADVALTTDPALVTAISNLPTGTPMNSALEKVAVGGRTARVSGGGSSAGAATHAGGSTRQGLQSRATSPSFRFASPRVRRSGSARPRRVEHRTMCSPRARRSSTRRVAVQRCSTPARWGSAPRRLDSGHSSTSAVLGAQTPTATRASARFSRRGLDWASRDFTRASPRLARRQRRRRTRTLAHHRGVLRTRTLAAETPAAARVAIHRRAARPTAAVQTTVLRIAITTITTGTTTTITIPERRRR